MADMRSVVWAIEELTRAVNNLTEEVAAIKNAMKTKEVYDTDKRIDINKRVELPKGTFM